MEASTATPPAKNRKRNGCKYYMIKCSFCQIWFLWLPWHNSLCKNMQNSGHCWNFHIYPSINLVTSSDEEGTGIDHSSFHLCRKSSLLVNWLLLLRLTCANSFEFDHLILTLFHEAFLCLAFSLFTLTAFTWVHLCQLLSPTRTWLSCSPHTFGFLNHLIAIYSFLSYFFPVPFFSFFSELSGKLNSLSLAAAVVPAAWWRFIGNISK